jgi:excisionase family DNA binding protein
MNALINADEMAELLGVDASTVRRLAREGRISHFRVGTSFRFDPEVVLAELAVPARPQPASAPTSSPATHGRRPRAQEGNVHDRSGRRRALKRELFS